APRAADLDKQASVTAFERAEPPIQSSELVEAAEIAVSDRFVQAITLLLKRPKPRLDISRGLLHIGKLRLGAWLGLLAPLVLGDKQLGNPLRQLLRVVRIIPGHAEMQDVGVRDEQGGDRRGDRF